MASHAAESPAPRPSADIVIPVYNEEHSLPTCLERLLPFCRDNLTAYHWRVVIADNGSIDRTYDVAMELSQRYTGEVGVVHLDQTGRGRALKQAWGESGADIRAYMDVDLSTDINRIPDLLGAIADGYDLATGSRLKRGAQTARSFKREFVSRSYNLMIKSVFCSSFSDAQCGFKALSRRAADDLLPLVKDNDWFFDTELLLIAEKNGYTIADFPVAWEEDADTRVKIISTAWQDIKGLARLRLGGRPKPKRR